MGGDRHADHGSADDGGQRVATEREREEMRGKVSPREETGATAIRELAPSY
jgi:hypothetical protein